MQSKKTRLWKYEEINKTHTLTKFYKEEHGEGEDMGEFSDDEVREILLSVKPDIDVESSLHTLQYFGFLPLLVQN